MVKREVRDSSLIIKSSFIQVHGPIRRSQRRKTLRHSNNVSRERVRTAEIEPLGRWPVEPIARRLRNHAQVLRRRVLRIRFLWGTSALLTLRSMMQTDPFTSVLQRMPTHRRTQKIRCEINCKLSTIESNRNDVICLSLLSGHRNLITQIWANSTRKHVPSSSHECLLKNRFYNS